MPTQKKIDTVAELREQLGRATIAISTDYRGLSVGQTQALRRKLREADADFRVVKLTLLRLAATDAGRDALLDVVEGPTALALGYDDIIAPAKVLSEHVRQTRLPLTVRGGWAEGRVLSATDIGDLASAPSREELLGRIMGGLQSPLVNLASLLTATLREFAGLVEARADQLGESQPRSAPASASAEAASAGEEASSEDGAAEEPAASEEESTS